MAVHLRIKFFIFDLETTGLNRQKDEICQIAVQPYDEDGPQPFNIHILPNCDFHPKASEVNGYTISYSSSSERSLTKLGQPVETTTLAQGIKEFYDYLRRQSSSGSKIVLIGYNCKSFDVPILLRDIEPPADMRYKILYADAYLLMKKIRHTKLVGIPSLKQETVYRQVSGVEILNPIHDAVKDTFELREILKSPKLSISLEDILEHSFVPEPTAS